MVLEELLNYIKNLPITWILLTIVCFNLGNSIYEKTNKAILFQPILVSYIILLFLIYFTNTSYQVYYKNVELLNFFLYPAVVSLALPLYKNIKLIKSLFLPIIITLIIGSISTVLITLLFLYLTNASLVITKSMLSKSITAPIAVILSEQINSIQSLAISFIIITGIFGSMISPYIFKIFKIKNNISKGFSLGLVSHVIGAIKAREISQKAVSFAIVGMVLNGIISSILLSMIFK